MAGDWVKLHRQILDSAVFQRRELLQIFVWCIMRANWKDTEVFVDRISQPVMIKRGQFITGRFAMHAELYPKKRKDTPAPITTWRWLETLEKMGNLTIKTNSRYSIVTVCNYGTYQEDETKNDQVNDQQVISRRSADDQQVITEEEGKEVQEGKEVRGVIARAQPADAKPSRVDSRDINAVIEHYQTYHPRSRPGEKERKAIAARLKNGYSVADLAKAIDGNHLSPYHCGENKDGREYHNLELIVREASKVDQFMAAADNAGLPVLSQQTKKAVRAGQQWIKRKREKESSSARI